MIDLTNTKPLSTEELREIVPSAFTKTGSKNVSDKYAHIPTDRVIRDMETLGWFAVGAQEVKARKQIGFQKHLVVFRNPDVFMQNNEDIVFPQILITNSSDGIFDNNMNKKGFSEIIPDILSHSVYILNDSLLSHILVKVMSDKKGLNYNRINDIIFKSLPRKAIKNHHFLRLMNHIFMVIDFLN